MHFVTLVLASRISLVCLRLHLVCAKSECFDLLAPLMCYVVYRKLVQKCFAFLLNLDYLHTYNGHMGPELENLHFFTEKLGPLGQKCLHIHRHTFVAAQIYASYNLPIERT